jgi:soluble lytic murein transglycosylase
MYAWGRLALQAARNHKPEALAWYKLADPNLLDNEQLAWKARAALRAADWEALTASIASMPPALQEDAAWRFWKARALKESGNKAAADVLLVPLSKERTFYGQLALEELGEVMSTPTVAYHASETDIGAIEKLPAVQRALILYRHGLRWESRQEWLWAIRNMDDKHLLAAAEYASRQEWYDLAINTADKTQLTHDFALRYPTPYRDQMQSYARANQLDEAWLYGLVRQESRFVTEARSGVGASGLMQLMPATAKWIAKKIGFGPYQTNMIHQLDTNIQFGTYYLRHILEVVNGQSVMATAAYNAGPGRAKRWVDDKPLEGAIYIETIPFFETRDYVKKVMSNAQYYAQRLGTQMQTIKQRLGTVASVSSNTAVDTTDPDEN